MTIEESKLRLDSSSSCPSAHVVSHRATLATLLLPLPKNLRACAGYRRSRRGVRPSRLRRRDVEAGGPARRHKKTLYVRVVSPRLMFT
jgi:hypothetical protein